MEWLTELGNTAMHYVQNLDPFYAYLILMLASIVENIFPPAPGDAITVFGASLVGTGHLSFIGVLMATTIGSLMGFMSYYFVGLKLERSFIESGKLKFISKEGFENAEKWFDKYGYGIVLANRFLSGIRSIISLFCGISQLDVKRVALYSTISALVWNSLLITAGMLLGQNWEKIKDYLASYAQIITALIILAVIVFLIRKLMMKRKNAG
ncbi:MAG: DedA family protein [Calditrichaeota bacterium]|nr:DedA family protein [Calditrichota bacterium]